MKKKSKMKKIDVIIFSGQSNMQGQAERLSENETVADAYEYRFLTDEIKPLCNPVGETVCFDGTAGTDLSPDVPLRDVLKDWLATHVTGASCYGYTNLVPEFCREYVEKTGREVLAVHVAKGSTEIAYWMPGGEAYAFLVKKARAAIAKVKESYDVGRVFFVWLQGESDAVAARSKEYYKKNITELCESLKKDIGIEKFGIIRVGRFTGDSRDDEIIGAQVDVCHKSNDFIMLTEICEELSKEEEYMNQFVAGHYSATGYEAIGRAAGESLGEFTNITEETAMIEEKNDFVPENEITPVVLLDEKKKMRRTFSRVGWAVLVLTVAIYPISLIVGMIVGLFSDAGMDFFNKNLLYLNEVMVALAVGAGALVFIGMPKSAPTKRRATAKEFFVYLLICFGIGYVGNLIGTVMLNVWNSLTGNEVTNELVEIISSLDVWQTVICTGILAPVIEELFFRKLIIDRARKYGDLAAILVSAAFFGLFHQNFSQFFYTFGVGVLLGYVYCRTGSYLTVTLLHMGFNLIMGVLPSIITPEVLLFLEEYMVLVTAEDFDAIVTLVIEYAKPLAIFFVYSAVQMALDITGIVLFFLNYKKVRLERAETALAPREQVRAIIANFGIIASVVVLIGLTVSTLFTA